MTDTDENDENLKKMMKTDDVQDARKRALAVALVAAKRADEDEVRLARAKRQIH